jgi:hypothetical protein
MEKSSKTRVFLSGGSRTKPVIKYQDVTIKIGIRKSLPPYKIVAALATTHALDLGALAQDEKTM